MAKPPNEVRLTLEDVQAEIEALAAGHRAAKDSKWTQERIEILLHMRDEQRLPWDIIAGWWKKKFGWGSDKTLSSKYRELKQGG